jgi:hypothetical protein
VPTDPPLEPGRLFVRRQFMRADLLSRVWVGRVVADDDRGLWMWIAAGSPYVDIGASDGRRFRDIPFGDWGRTDKALHQYIWRGDRLMFHPPGEAYSVWFRFSGGQRESTSERAPASEAETSNVMFDSWYVNLEDPAVRWDDGSLAGVDTVDHDLDIVVEPDRTWRWKDADEFAAHLAHPEIYWVDDEAAVRAEGERVVKLIEDGAFPFDGTGTDFRPDPSWPVPTAMPDGYDRPRAR